MMSRQETEIIACYASGNMSVRGKERRPVEMVEKSQNVVSLQRACGELLDALKTSEAEKGT